MKKKSGANLVNIGLLVVNVFVIGLVALKVHYGWSVTDILEKASSVVSTEQEAGANKQVIPAERAGDTRKVEKVDTADFGVEMTEDMERTLSDGSNLTRQVDGYGNIAVTRTFRGHKLIRLLVIRMNRKKETTVYIHGKNGKPVLLDPKFHENVLNESADDIATNAGIIDSKNENDLKRERLAVIKRQVREEAAEKVRQMEAEERRRVEVANQQEEVNSGEEVEQ